MLDLLSSSSGVDHIMCSLIPRAVYPRQISLHPQTLVAEKHAEIVAGKTGAASAIVGNDLFLSPLKDGPGSPVVAVS